VKAFCTLLLVGFVMMVELFVQNGVVWCGCMVEKCTITELNCKFVKIDDFVKYGAILVQFAEKWVLKIECGVIFSGGFAENGCKNVAFGEKMLFLHRVAIC
jgi:hypothetical protein